MPRSLPEPPRNTSFLTMRQLSIFVISIILFLQNEGTLSAAPYYHQNYELIRPIVKPNGVKPCVVPLLSRYIFGAIPKVTFAPPPACGLKWSLAVLSWSARMNYSTPEEGVYSVTIFFDGLAIAKTTTPNSNPKNTPGTSGATSSVEFDVTRYSPFISQKGTVRVYRKALKTGTGVLSANLTLTLYPGTPSFELANKILPLSLNTSSAVTPFILTSSVKSSTVVFSNIPRNVHRAQLEILQLAGGSEIDYWKFSTEKCQFVGGPFRETLVYVDAMLAGATWQHPIAVRNSFSPNLFNPVVGIGAFRVPTYTIDLTPFVGLLIDGKNHSIKLAVTGITSSGFWEISGALHLWLDKNSKQTSGKLIARKVADAVTPSKTCSIGPSPNSEVDAVNVTIRVQRVVNITGRVNTSFGSFSVSVVTNLALQNTYRRIADDGDPTDPLQLYSLLDYHVHEVKGLTSVSLMFANHSNFYSYIHSFHYPLTAYFWGYMQIGDFSSTSTIDHSVDFNTSRKYGLKPALTEGQKNKQSTFLNFLPLYLSGSQNLTYRSSFQGCYKRSSILSDGLFTYDKSDAKC